VKNFMYFCAGVLCLTLAVLAIAYYSTPRIVTAHWTDGMGVRAILSNGELITIKKDQQTHRLRVYHVGNYRDQNYSVIRYGNEILGPINDEG
jgi:hypothetical protein